MDNRVIVILSDDDDDDDNGKPTVKTANKKDIVVIDDSEDDINLPPTSSNSCATRTSPEKGSLKRKRNNVEDKPSAKRKKTEHNPPESELGFDFDIHEPSIMFTACSSKDAEPSSTKTHSPDSYASTGQSTATNPSNCSDESQCPTTKDHRSNALKQNCCEKRKRVVVLNNNNSSGTLSTACSSKDEAPNSTKTHSPDSCASTGQNTATNPRSTCSDESQSWRRNAMEKVVCPVCSQTSNYKNFVKHYRKAHLPHCRYCVKCNLCCYNNSNVDIHLKNPKHTFRCPFCVSESGKEWRFDELVQHFKFRHKEQYFNGESYVCPPRFCCRAILKSPFNFMIHYLRKHDDVLNTVEVATQYCHLCIRKHVHLNEENSLAHFMEEHHKVLTKEVYEVLERSEHASMVAGIDKDKLPSSSDAEPALPSTSSNKSLPSNDKKNMRSSSNSKTDIKLPSLHSEGSSSSAFIFDFPPSSSNDINVSLSASNAQSSSNNRTNPRSSLNGKNNLPIASASNDKVNTQSPRNNKTHLKSLSRMNDGHSPTTSQSNAAAMGRNLTNDLVSGSSLVRNKEPQSHSSHGRNRTKSAPSSTSGKRKRENCDSTTTRKDGCSTQSNNSQAHSSHKRPRTRSASSNVSNTSLLPPTTVARSGFRQVLSNLSNSPSVSLQNLSKFSHIVFIDLDNWGRFFDLPYPLPSDVFVWGFCGGNYTTNKPWSGNFRVLVEERRFVQHPKCGKSKNAADFALCMQAARLDLQLPTHIPFTVLSGDKGFDELRNQLESSARQIHLLNPHDEDQDMLYALLTSIGQK